MKTFPQDLTECGKILVIHPQDSTTDFLKVIYQDIRNCKILSNEVDLRKSNVKKNIKESEFVIMLGHGTEWGLINPHNQTLCIDSGIVDLLRTKLCISIWCNANLFVEKYGLIGLYSGMIISDYAEAQYESVTATYQEIDESNIRFANAIKSFADKGSTLSNIKKLYSTENLNRVIDYNIERIFFTKEPIIKRKSKYIRRTNVDVITSKR